MARPKYISIIFSGDYLRYGATKCIFLVALIHHGITIAPNSKDAFFTGCPMFIASAFILYLLAFAMIGSGGYFAMDGSQMLTIDRGVAYFNSGVALATGGMIVFAIATFVLCTRSVYRAIKNGQNVSPVVVQAAPAAVQEEASQVKSGMSDFGSKAAEPAAASGYPTISPLQANDDAGARKSSFGFSASRSADRPVEEPVAPKYEQPSVSRDYNPLPRPDAFETAAPVAEAEVRAAAAREAPPERKATAVGSYESGGNRYVMYSDGSIDAHLPGGVRTFQSLDELKQYVGAPAV